MRHTSTATTRSSWSPQARSASGSPIGRSISPKAIDSSSSLGPRMTRSSAAPASRASKRICRSGASTTAPCGPPERGDMQQPKPPSDRRAYPMTGADRGSGPDAALVRAVAAGSHDALAALYDRHADAVFAAASRLTSDRGMAEDVVQETFLALWDRAETFDPGIG